MAGEETKQAGGAGTPDRIGGLKSRVDELAKLTEQLEESRKAAKWTRLGIMFVILFVIVCFVLVNYSMIRNFDKAKFMAEARARMFDTQRGTLFDLIQVANRLIPVYQGEIQKQFGNEWPNIQAQIKTQADLLVKNVGEKTEVKLKAKLAGMAERVRSRVFAEFPELKDEKTREIVMTNLQIALQGAVVDVLNDRIKKGEDRMVAAYMKILALLPKESQETFHLRWQKVWEQFLLVDMGGARYLK